MPNSISNEKENPSINMTHTKKPTVCIKSFTVSKTQEMGYTF